MCVCVGGDGGGGMCVGCVCGVCGGGCYVCGVGCVCVKVFA